MSKIQSLKSKLRHLFTKGINYYNSQKRMGIRRKQLKESNLLGPRSANYIKDVKAYWLNHFDKKINPLWHIACANAIGVEDVRYIPHDVWEKEIAPYFNDFQVSAAYSDKNLDNVLLKIDKGPVTILKRMHGRYYDANNIYLSRAEVLDLLTSSRDGDSIIKPSKTDDGFGINSLRFQKQLLLGGKPCTLADIEKGYGDNFLIQEKIKQYPGMAEVHPGSVNTIRMVTLRWQDEVNVLLAFARFGTKGKITDNAGTGGVCCGIDEKGRLFSSAIDMRGQEHEKHPTTGYSFKNNLLIPNYPLFCKYAIDLHSQMFHFDIVSWDLAVGFEGEPVFLEMNFLGASYMYQFACRRPMFGDLTTDVLEKVRDSRQNT